MKSMQSRPWVPIALLALALPCHALSRALSCVPLQGKPSQERAAAQGQEAHVHSSPCESCAPTVAGAAQGPGSGAPATCCGAALAKPVSVAPGIMSQGRLPGA